MLARHSKRAFAGLAWASLGLLAAPITASACGGAISNDPNYHVTESATMVAFHNGVEHYLTTFAYNATDLATGWLLPVPARPQVEKGDATVLNQFADETERYRSTSQFHFGFGAAAPAHVIDYTRIDSLGLTTLAGTGDGVLQWCSEQGFHVDTETASHIRTYANATQLFLAARYEAAPAAPSPSSGPGATQSPTLPSQPVASVPILLTMQVDHPWVPLELLAPHAGNAPSIAVYLITDNRLDDGEHLLGGAKLDDIIAGSSGLRVDASEPLPGPARDSIAGLKGMSWFPSSAWLTSLSLDATTAVDYDLTVTSDNVIRLASFGTDPSAAANNQPAPRFTPSVDLGEVLPGVLLVLAWLAGVVGVLAIIWRRERRQRRPIPR